MRMFFLLLQSDASSSNPEDAWNRLGPLLLLAFLAIPAVRSFLQMKRPLANAKCYMSLITLIGAWGVLVFWMAVIGINNALKGDEEPSGLLIPISLLSILLFFCSQVLAVLGLIEFRRRPGRYVEGKEAAFATLGHTAFFALMIALTLALQKVSDPHTSQVIVLWTPAVIVAVFFLWRRFKRRKTH